MSWWSGLDEAAILTFFLFGPGLLVGAVLGLRRVLLLVAAPALSVAILSASPVLLGPLGIAWTPASAVASTLAVAAGFAALRLLLRHSWRVGSDPAGALWPVLVAVVVAVPFAAIPLHNGMGFPDSPPQTWDAVFHLNGSRAILDTGDGSSLTLGRLNAPAKDLAIYPAAWHDVAALAVRDDIVVTANVLTLLISAVVWPLGLAGLASVLVRSSKVAPVAAALAGTALVSFPARVISYGTLWPTALAYALVPAALMVTLVVVARLQALGTHKRASFPVSEVITLLAVLGGAGLAHPTAVLAYAVIAAPIWIPLWWRGLTAARRAGGAWRWAGVVAPVLACVVAAVLARPLFRAKEINTRDPYGTAADAIVGALTDSQFANQGFGNPEKSWLLGALIVVGMLATLVVRRHRWLAIGMVTTTALFVLAVDSALPGAFLVRPWYSDPVRLGAMVALVVPLLVAVAVAWLGELATRWMRGPARRRILLAEVVSAALVVVLVLGTGGLRGQLRVHQLQINYAFIPQSGFNSLVSPDEQALLERVDDELPDDAVVLANPYTGAPLLYGLSDVDVVYPHLGGSWGKQQKFLATSFDQIETNPRVCATLRDLGVKYVYGDDLLYWPDHEDIGNYRGLFDLASVADVLEPVDSGGGATLYRITACGF
ncbi:DUF6541 family protein [Georgenia sp. SYP-B2076]|uniref:DUF6541 family protein n=1 Tax=Georgenia sp. SYP-B2076 TaxID=2495881 RepID=UPI000F8EB222|nr:DUF6541 family protein [Georgenia sp. SYP-B2076]